MVRGATVSPDGTWSPARPPSSDYVVAALSRVAATEVPEGARLTLDGTAYLPGAVSGRRAP